MSSLHVCVLSVVAGILSATHKIGRHVITVTCVNEMTHVEPITEQVHNGRFLENITIFRLLVKTKQWCYNAVFLTCVLTNITGYGSTLCILYSVYRD